MFGRSAAIAIIEANEHLSSIHSLIVVDQISATNPAMCGEIGVTLPPT